MSTGTGIEYGELKEIADPGAGPSTTLRLWLDSTLKNLLGRFGSGAPIPIALNVPLTRYRYIDGAVAAPIAQQNGSESTPFASIAAWLTAIGVSTSGVDGQTFQKALLCPVAVAGGYTENPAIPAYRNILLESAAKEVVAGITGSITWANVAGGGAVAPTNNALLQLDGIKLSGGITVTDDGSVNATLAISQYSRFATTNVGGTITATGATALTVISIRGATVAAIVSTANVTGAALLYGSGAAIGNITAKNIGSGLTITNAISGGARFTGSVYTVASGQPAIFFQSRFGITNPVVSGGLQAIFDGPTWASFVEAGGSVTSPMVAIVQGGYLQGVVPGAALTNADLTLSLDGTGATVGFTDGGNYYQDAAALLGANRIRTFGVGGAKKGDTICYSRRDLSANTVTLKDGAAATLYVFPALTGGAAILRFDGAQFALHSVGNSLT